MADNTKQTASDTIATDDIAAGVAAGAKVQRMKVGYGKDGEYADASSEAPLPVGDGGGSLTVDSPVLGETADAEATGNGSVIGLLKRLRKLLEGTGVIKVSKVEEALPAGTNNIGQVDARGNVAHDAVDSGNPVKIGGRARTELPAAVSAQNDRADFLTDGFGRQLAVPIPVEQRVSSTLNRTTAEEGQLLAALASGAYVVTAIKVVNASPTTATKVEILDGASVKDKGGAGTNNGGWQVSDPNGLFVTTKNTALKAKCVTTGADVDIFVSAYKIPA